MNEKFEQEYAYWTKIMQEIKNRDKEMFELECNVIGLSLSSGPQVQRMLELERTNESDDVTKMQYIKWKNSWRERGIKI